MKLTSILLLIIALASASCSSKNKSDIVEEIKANDTQTFISDYDEDYKEDYKEEYNDNYTTLSIGKNKIDYLAVHYRHVKLNDGFEIYDRFSNVLAARFNPSTNAYKSGWNDDLNIFYINNDVLGAVIEVVDLDLSAELIYLNMGREQKDFSKEIIENQLVIKNQNPEVDGVFIKKITDAPLLYRPDSILKLAPTFVTMSDYRVGEKSKLVKRIKKSKSEIESFEILKSIDLTKEVESSFYVDMKLEELENGYSLIEFRVTNPFVDTAFLISNPFDTISSECRSAGNPFAIDSYREEVNTIVVRGVVQSFTKPKCLDEAKDKLEGFIYIFDENFNYIKVNYVVP